MRLSRTLLVGPAGVLFLFALSPTSVEAHAALVRAIPAPGSVLRAVPPQVRLWFSEELEPSLSTLTVWGPRAVTAVSGTGGVDLNDLTRRSMVARLKPLRAGTYTVRWKAAAADDLAVTQGSYEFVVKP